MATKQELASLDLYNGLMTEAQARALSINTLSNDQRGIPSPLVREYCFLQLRMLCEVIGLACLVANGNIVDKGPASLRKAYAPAEILRLLEALHPDFYPVPILPKKTAEGWHFDHYAGGPFLTKQELPSPWNKCGDVLHRGGLEKLIAAKSPVQATFADVNDWGQKILNLLSCHRIKTFGGRVVFMCFLQANDAGGAVQVAIAEAPEE